MCEMLIWIKMKHHPQIIFILKHKHKFKNIQENYIFVFCFLFIYSLSNNGETCVKLRVNRFSSTTKDLPFTNLPKPFIFHQSFQYSQFSISSRLGLQPRFLLPKRCAAIRKSSRVSFR